MKARTVSLIIIVSVLLMALAAAPVGAGTKTTDYTGTVAFSGTWEDLELKTTPGGTTHELVLTSFFFNTDDPRVTGDYMMTSKCTWPHGKPFPYGPCQATWTLNNDADPQPEWEGLVTLNPGLHYDQWNGNGRGLDEYTGLKLSFKVNDMADGEGPVVGQVIGN